MSKKLLTNLDLNKNQLVNASMERLASAPSTPVVGHMYYNTTDNRPYVRTSSAWVAMQSHPIKHKTADETVNSSTTLQNDDHLTFDIDANEKWSFEAEIYADTVAEAGLKVSVNGPAAPTNVIANVEIKSGLSPVAQGRITSFDSPVTHAGAITDGMVTIKGTVENGANAGTVAIRFAQNASDAGNTTFKRGSILEYRKIG